MQIFQLEELTGDMSVTERAWQEFLRVPALSMGIYRLRAGDADKQPHTEDEVYYVIGGCAQFRAGNEKRAVRAGTILFVERNFEHRFFDITEDLTILVFFAPAEHSNRSKP
jgi:mannose-6-phosphate isomerase-like protein (cupin superfamily)